MEKVTEERSGAIVEEFLDDGELDVKIVRLQSSISILQKELRNEELEIMENRAPSFTISDKLYNDLRHLSSLYSSKAKLVLGRALEIQQKKCDFLVRTLFESVPDLVGTSSSKLTENENAEGKNTENAKAKGKLPVDTENPSALNASSGSSARPTVVNLNANGLNLGTLPVKTENASARPTVVHPNASSGSLLQHKKARAKRFGIPLRDEPDQNASARPTVVHLNASSGSLLQQKKARAKCFGIPLRDEPDQTDKKRKV